MQVEYIKPSDDKRSPSGCGEGHVTRFLNFAQNHVFGICHCQARYFKLHVLIDIQEYLCMHYTLLPKVMCSESYDLFKFWEISDNIKDDIAPRKIDNSRAKL